MSGDAFSGEQQEYLKGFISGVEARRSSLGLPLAPVAPGSEPAPSADPQRAAQDRVLASGGKLVPEEQAKRATDPLDRLPAIAALAEQGRFPRGTDVFLTKYHGLFYVAPAQDSFMCRLRLPGGIVSSAQFRDIAAIADDFGGGYADVTTRANLQIRQIAAASAPEILMRLSEAGLTSRGAGADNVRNITGSPTAGIDPDELIDTRPHVRALHHHILFHRDLYGLPRKFNIAFDGGGRIPVLQETNDIALTAVRSAGAVSYRLALGGITGHGDIARDAAVLVPPDDAVRVCDAVLRVFIAEGDRTDRKRARLKYLLDRWGLDRFLAAVEAELGRPLLRADQMAIDPAAPQDRHAHIGVHPQRQPGLRYIGLVCPAGRLGSDVLRGLADLAERHGSGTLRLTVWQNLLVSDVRAERIDAALGDIAALGLAWEASAVRAGLVACTGSAGCRFSASDTKSHARALADWLDARIALDQPLNIHLTGCPHSCAQHFIADIGLLGTRVERGDDTVDGYDVHVGGGAGAHARIGRLIAPGVAYDAVPGMILALLSAWQKGRASPDESFQSYTACLSDAALAAVCVREPAAAAP